MDGADDWSSKIIPFALTYLIDPPPADDDDSDEGDEEDEEDEDDEDEDDDWLSINFFYSPWCIPQ